MAESRLVAQVACGVTAATRASLGTKEVRARRAKRDSSGVGPIERAERLLQAAPSYGGESP